MFHIAKDCKFFHKTMDGVRAKEERPSPQTGKQKEKSNA